MSADASSLLESVETSDDWAARCLAPVKHQALSVRSIDSSGLPLGPHRVLSTAGTFGSPLNSDPTISIADASITEGGAGPKELEFEVTLSAAATDTVRIDVEVVAQSANRLVTERLARGLSEPVFLTSAPGDQQTLFVVEQDGVIKRINRDTGDVASTPFLTVTDLSTGGERGLLGLAFHPQYESNRYLYIYMTDSGGDTLIRRYTANENGLTANPASVVPVLGFEQPFSNHNAGWMDFGPDGFLYIASGDGGSGNDPRNNAQDTT
ncbi:MAG: PQQ-dependent sugar dehydrogenase, partial [Planctomycetota bacterium]